MVDLEAVTVISSMGISLLPNLQIAVEFFFSSIKHRFLAAGEHLNCNFPYVSYEKREEGVSIA